MVEVRRAQLARIAERIGIDVGDVRDLVVFKACGRRGVQKIQFSVVGNVKRTVYAQPDVAVIDIPFAARRGADELKALRRAFGTVNVMPVAAARLAEIKIPVVVYDFGRVCAVRSRFRIGNGVAAVRPVDEVVRFENLDPVAGIGGGRVQIIFSVIAHDEGVADAVLPVRPRRVACAPLPFDLDRVFIPPDFGRDIRYFFFFFRGTARKRRRGRHQCSQCNYFSFHFSAYLSAYPSRAAGNPAARTDIPFMRRS